MQHYASYALRRGGPSEGFFLEVRDTGIGISPADCERLRAFQVQRETL